MVVLLFWITYIFLHRASDSSPLNPSISHSKEDPGDVSDSFYVMEKVQQKVAAAVHAGDMEVLPVAYVRGFTARHLLCGVGHKTCKACMTSQVMLSTSQCLHMHQGVRRYRTVSRVTI
jgi:hypothetical protein